MKHYQHLNEEERFYIWNALRTDSSQVDVAQPLNRGPSTICREIKKIKGSGLAFGKNQGSGLAFCHLNDTTHSTIV